jgi:UDP-N-acetylmuramyl pentapeptide synthase
MPNKVFLNKNEYIEIIYEGDQTSETVNNVVDETLKIISILKKQNKPVKIINDLSKLGGSSMGARKTSAETLEKVKYDKVALFGANLFMKYLAILIIKASGMGEKVKYFDTREEAEKWLAEVVD